VPTSSYEITNDAVTVVADRIWRCRPVSTDRTWTSIESLLFEITLNEAKHETHISMERGQRVLRIPLEIVTWPPGQV
jgi:hypothetical protein